MTEKEIESLINDAIISRDYMVNIDARDFNSLRKEGRLDCVKVTFNPLTDTDALRTAVSSISDKYGADSLRAVLLIYAFNPESRFSVSAFAGGGSIGSVLPSDVELTFGIRNNTSVPVGLIDATIFFAIKN